MTVTELIEELSKQPGESKVYFHDPYEGPSSVSRVEFHSSLDYALTGRVGRKSRYFTIKDATWLVEDPLLDPSMVDDFNADLRRVERVLDGNALIDLRQELLDESKSLCTPVIWGPGLHRAMTLIEAKLGK